MTAQDGAASALPLTDAVARLRRHPGFPAAVAASARNMVSFHSGGRLMTWMLSDRARAVLPYVLLYLDATWRPDDPRSGLTVSRMKALCADAGICSAGRAGALFALARIGGFVTPAPDAADRRVRRYVPGDRMLDLVRMRLRLQCDAIGAVCPGAQRARDLLGDAAFERALWRYIGEDFMSGVRLLDHAPALTLFAERASGMVLLFSLATAGGSDDTVPPARPVPIAIADLARRFNVSRAHVLRLLRDAEAAGLLVRSGAQQDQVRLTASAADALLDMMGATFIFLDRAFTRAAAEIRA